MKAEEEGRKHDSADRKSEPPRMPQARAPEYLRDFIVAFLALSAGVPLLIVGISVFAENIRTLTLALVVVLVVSCMAGYLLLAARSWIQRQVFRVGEKALAELVNPLEAATNAMLENDLQNARTYFWDFARSALDRYAWVNIRNWVIHVVLGMVVTFTALVGSALLFSQNEPPSKAERQV
jgi:hypothetical protein